jgi:phosphoribosylformimino-5-aminoimidazole carboxamide ribonucleotide (ProFAR) isomerase
LRLAVFLLWTILLPLRELVPLGLEGAILGKALYAGAFTLTEALDVAGR